MSFRSDLYALGSTLYEALAGKATFPVADLARRVQLQTEGDPAPLEGAPEGLARLVFTLLSREQRDRPFSAQQVERQLEPLAKAPPAPSVEGLDAPEEGERTVAFDPTSAKSPAVTTTPGLADSDDRADDAPTRLNAHLELPGASTIVGMTAPVVSAPQASPAPSAPPAVSATSTVNGRLPKMPTLPPIPSASRSSMPGPVPSSAPAVPAPPPAARRATMLGMPMTDPNAVGALPPAPPAAAPPPPAAPPPAVAAPPTAGATRPGAKGGLDYDDLGDTTVNDESRAFGLPGYPAPQGSAVPPLAGDGAPSNGAPRPAAGAPAMPPP